MKKSTGLTRASIVRTLRKHDEELKRFSAKRIGLFGSYVRNRQRRGSDIDFLVEFETSTYDNFYGLSVYLEKLFGKRVEILTPDGVDSIRVQEVAQSIRESVEYV